MFVGRPKGPLGVEYPSGRGIPEQTWQDTDKLLFGRATEVNVGKMNEQSFEVTTKEWAGSGIACLFLVVSVAHSALTRQVRAQETTEHPFIEPSAINSDTCLTCHPNKKEGKFVHSGIATGCEKCHRASSENGKTTITPVATGGELCAMCHEAKVAPVAHVPYRQGQCLICHEPHTSNFPGQVRAETNLLCLSCHGVNQPDVEVNQQVNTVSLPGGQTLPLDEYRQAVRISLDRSGTKGHPIKDHPISGRDPRKKGAALTCLSCHMPHSSPSPGLLPAGVKNRLELCHLCHK